MLKAFEEKDSDVLTLMVRNGISINNKDYEPMSALDAVNLWNELCDDCKGLLRGTVERGLENDFFWSTMYSHYLELTGCKPKGTRCKHCEGIVKGTVIDIPRNSMTSRDEEEDTGGYRGDGANDLDNKPYKKQGTTVSTLRQFLMKT